MTSITETFEIDSTHSLEISVKPLENVSGYFNLEITRKSIEDKYKVIIYGICLEKDQMNGLLQTFAKIRL
jgi:hypothetical protein